MTKYNWRVKCSAIVFFYRWSNTKCVYAGMDEMKCNYEKCPIRIGERENKK